MLLGSRRAVIPPDGGGVSPSFLKTIAGSREEVPKTSRSPVAPLASVRHKVLTPSFPEQTGLTTVLTPTKVVASKAFQDSGTEKSGRRLLEPGDSAPVVRSADRPCRIATPSPPPRSCAVPPGYIQAGPSDRYFWKKGAPDDKPLGSGYTSTVYRGLDNVSGDAVAIKLVPKHKQRLLATDSYYRQLYRLLPTQSHPSILRLRDILEDAESFYIISDLCSGPDLVDYVLEFTPRSIPLDDVRNIVLQILLGIHHLHGRQLIHRDIKLDNILFVDLSRKQIAIVDFDMTLMRDHPDPPRPPKSPEEISVVGTKDYMAPEGYRGEYSEASDLWSVGVILYILLDGHFPYDLADVSGGRAIRDVLRQGVVIAPEVKRRCPAAVDLVLKLLNFDIKQRITTAADALRHPWLAQRAFARTSFRCTSPESPGTTPGRGSSPALALTAIPPQAPHGIVSQQRHHMSSSDTTPPHPCALILDAAAATRRGSKESASPRFQQMLSTVVEAKGQSHTTRSQRSPPKGLTLNHQERVRASNEKGLMDVFTAASSDGSTLASSYERGWRLSDPKTSRTGFMLGTATTTATTSSPPVSPRSVRVQMTEETHTRAGHGLHKQQRKQVPAFSMAQDVTLPQSAAARRCQAKRLLRWPVNNDGVAPSTTATARPVVVPGGSLEHVKAPLSFRLPQQHSAHHPSHTGRTVQERAAAPVGMSRTRAATMAGASLGASRMDRGTKPSVVPPPFRSPSVRTSGLWSLLSRQTTQTSVPVSTATHETTTQGSTKRGRTAVASLKGKTQQQQPLKSRLAKAFPLGHPTRYATPVQQRSAKN